MIFKIQGGVIGEPIYCFENGDAWVALAPDRFTLFRDELITQRAGGYIHLGTDPRTCDVGLKAKERAMTTRVNSLDLPHVMRQTLCTACQDFYMDEEVRGYTVLDLLRLTMQEVLAGRHHYFGPTRIELLKQALAARQWAICDLR